MDAKKLVKAVRVIKLLTIEQDSVLAMQLTKKKQFNERLIVSYLAYRDRIKEGATVNKIASDTGLAVRTTKQSITTLQDFLVKSNHHWRLPDYAHESFVDDSQLTGEHWSDKKRYVKLFMPVRGAEIDYGPICRRFGLLHSAVYSMVVSLAKENSFCMTTDLGIGKLLSGIHRRTVSSCLNDLDHLGLIGRERLGDRLKVHLHDVNARHLGLFQSRPKPKKIEVKLPPDPSRYEWKKDGYDEWREKCQGLMPQVSAEKCIALARQLNFNYSGFADHVSQAVDRDTQNRLTGKQTLSNLGAFLYSILDGILQKRKEEEQQRKRQEEHLAWIESDEYKAEQEKELAEAEANPLHRSHPFSERSVLARVDISYLSCTRLIAAYTNHLMDFMIKTNECDPIKVRRHSTIIAKYHLCHALDRVNEHYGADSRATIDEFLRKLTDVTSSVKEKSIPPFKWKPRGVDEESKDSTSPR